MARRQPNGRPSIYRGKDGWWHCYPTVGKKPNGKLDRPHLRGRTAEEVKAKLEELLKRRPKGRTAALRTETVGQWLEHWLENVVKPRRAYKTYEAYRPIVRLHVAPRIGHWRMRGLRDPLEPEHLDAMYADLAKTLAPSYVVQVHRVLRKAMKDAVRRDRADRNVCDLVDSPSARKRHIRAHTLAEAQAIITTAAEDPMAARWLLGMLLGPRQGETLGVHWRGDETISRLDLDADPPLLHLVKQIQRRAWEHGCEDPVACARRHCRTKPCPPRYEHGCPDPESCKKLARFCPQRHATAGCARHRGKKGCPPTCRPGCTGHAKACPERVGGGLQEVDLKSDRSARTLVLPPVIVEALLRWREAQQRDRDRLGQRWDPIGLVFTTPTGTPIDPRRDHEHWEQLLVRAGVADTRLHAARHTAGTMMVGTGTDIAVVQELLGHTDIRTTREYVDIAAELKKQAAERVAAALFDGSLAALLQPSGATTPPRS